MNNFKVGQRFVSELEPDLGLGRVSEVESKNVTLEFPSVGQKRTYRMSAAPVKRYLLAPGETARNEKGVSFPIESVETKKGLTVYIGRGGRSLSENDLSSKVLSRPADLFKALSGGKTANLKEFQRRESAARLSALWQSSKVRGMIGPKTDLIPHQYYLTQRASSGSSLPRLMLSDEVGLGKTIEAGMIWHTLHMRGRVYRTLILVPESLKHQWMAEMKRRFNQIFTLVDEGYIRALFEGGDRPNPFEQKNEIICTVELLMDQPALIVDILKITWDLTIVDEAHHLVCEDGFTSHEYLLVNKISERTKGLLLLTGTPLQLHPESHFNRLKMLDPARFSDFNEFLKDQETYQKLASDLSKLPMDSGEEMSWDDLYKLVPKKSPIRPWLEKENSKSLTAGEWVRRIVDAIGTGGTVFRNTRRGVGGFPKRVLDAIPLKPNPRYREWVHAAALKDLDRSTDIQENGLLITPYAEGWSQDERIAWLETFLSKHRHDKVLLICEDIAVVKALAAVLAERIGEESFDLFHEELSILARDKAAAGFAREDGVNLLIASEIGSEGRNFQFSHHLILFDLPLDAALVEQRIGRLDRIGQNKEIIIHVPYVLGSAQEVMFHWYNEGLNAFGAPLMSGGELFLKYTDVLIETLYEPQIKLKSFLDEVIPLVKADSAELRKSIEKGRDKLLEFNSRDERAAAEIIAEIQKFDADKRLKNLVFETLQANGLDIEKSPIPECFVITTGPQVEAGTIPGMPDAGMIAQDSEESEQSVRESALTATMDRKQAMLHDNVDFLSWEHPLTLGMIDMATATGKGTTACTIWTGSGRQNFMMLFNFILEPSVMPEWGLSDIAGPHFIRVLVDGDGNNASDLLDALDKGESKDVPVPQNAPAVTAKIRFFEQAGLTSAKRIATEKMNELAETASLAVEHRIEQEYQRIHHLLTLRGKAEGSPVLNELRKNIQERKKAAASPQLRLDAIRLIVCR
ncbi:MAG: RNA polymerase-associated protein RapA [Fibrobacter sp.]|jgi:ATP-dependent helicase HepA|nr:RNA polymerase-associated protein RapA [Fibrobacter sp.]